MRFVRDAGGEINSAPERQEIPQAIELKRRPIRRAQRLQERAGRRIVIVNSPVAKIPDPEFTIHQGESPRCVEFAVGNDAPDQIAAGVEDVDETVAWLGYFVHSLR